jgi:recombinational DNA repair protein RecT
MVVYTYIWIQIHLNEFGYRNDSWSGDASQCINTTGPCDNSSMTMCIKTALEELLQKYKACSQNIILNHCIALHCIVLYCT